MLGVLRPHSPALAPPQRAAWRVSYCGLCAALGREFGTPLQAVHTFDGVFLALVAEGLAGPAPLDRVRCPLAPWSTRAVPAADRPGPRYAAAVQILAVDQHFADDAAEGSRLAAGVRGLLGGKAAHARGLLEALGVARDGLAGLDAHQAAVEATWPHPAAAAGPTAEATGVVFAQLARLVPGGDAALAGALSDLGAALGRVLYLVDALEDLKGDHRRGRFNPCLDPRGRLDPDRTEAACALLDEAVAGLPALVAVLPLRQHADIAHNVVAEELPRRAARCTARARDQVGARRAALERRAGLGAAALAWDRLLVAITATWLFLVRAREALAAPGPLVPDPAPRANHFCHPDCVKPSTYCGFGYPHDGHFGADDCASRWWSGAGRRLDGAHDLGSWAAVACPEDSRDYLCGECICCVDHQAGEHISGCCCQWPGWCQDLCAIWSWGADLVAVVWVEAEDRVG